MATPDGTRQRDGAGNAFPVLDGAEFSLQPHQGSVCLILPHNTEDHALGAVRKSQKAQCIAVGGSLRRQDSLEIDVEIGLQVVGIKLRLERLTTVTSSLRRTGASLATAGAV